MGEPKLTRQERKAYDRYVEIEEILEDDKKGLALVHDLVDMAASYIEAVVNMETSIKIIRFRIDDPIKQRERIGALDKFRTIKHNALIAQLKIVNRYLFKNYGDDVPIGGIYSLNPMTLSHEDRVAIAEWANYLAVALFKKGIVKLRT